MNRDVAIIIFNIVKRKYTVDLEIPLDITANELVIALNSAYELGILKNVFSKQKIQFHY